MDVLYIEWQLNYRRCLFSVFELYMRYEWWVVAPSTLHSLFPICQCMFTPITWKNYASYMDAQHIEQLLMWPSLHKPTDHSPQNLKMYFIVPRSSQTLADYDNVFFSIRLLILELYNILYDAVENVHFEKQAILASSMIPFHISI